MSTGAGIAIAVGGTLVLLGGIAWMVLYFRRSNARRAGAALDRLAQESARRGWRYVERDDSYAGVFNDQIQYTSRNPLHPLENPPHASEAHDIVTGTHRGRSFVAASFRTYHRGEYSLTRSIIVRTPSAGPALNVMGASGMQTAVNQALGWGARIGNPDFDRKYEVSAEDEGFAGTVLNPSMVEFLMADDRPMRGFTMLGDQFDVVDPVRDHRDPAELVPALDLRCDLLDRVPASAWSR